MAVVALNPCSFTKYEQTESNKCQNTDLWNTSLLKRSNNYNSQNGLIKISNFQLSQSTYYFSSVNPFTALSFALLLLKIKHSQGTVRLPYPLKLAIYEEECGNAMVPGQCYPPPPPPPFSSSFPSTSYPQDTDTHSQTHRNTPPCQPLFPWGHMDEGIPELSVVESCAPEGKKDGHSLMACSDLALKSVQRNLFTSD